ncbi:T9SS type A sorting domain-containing protein [Flavivirga eckloniae]|uniref:Secretion system C-terminal sorting domain-containing protein n=1 Tax=Flavivirga eckloniae TaxID=1803846 RepID=A0A2K9PTU7_9FLAO|nr:T9SS type A sorting domain-containing protein [Flavivirga eckloniae]AUP80481.1 hypothetical protein C1H87_17885 [Flavivirga eckloniae]
MKTQLTSFFLFISLLSYAQSAIGTYFSAPMSNYSIVTSASAIDESTAGANLTWTFDQLSEIGTSTDNYAAPTNAELTEYPGTTSVLTVSSTVGATTSESKVFTKDVSGAISFTAVKATNLELKYNIDNGLIGDFPLSYGYSNTDNIAGTYQFNAFSGTFTGTITTSVDAYGSLTLNDVGSGDYSGNVTRLKVVQNLNLGYLINPNAGTAIQTNYYYYDDTNGELIFRSAVVTINVPAISINQTNTAMECLKKDVLSTDGNEITSSQLRIISNPVKDVLNLSLKDHSIVVKAIRLSDISGKQILSVKGMHKSITVDYLPNGIYFATIDTNKGIVSMKFVKG